MRSLKGDKWKLACHEFASRNFFICGTSEHWMSGSGILVDEESGVRFIYIGHDETENSKSGNTALVLCCLGRHVVYGGTRVRV